MMKKDEKPTTIKFSKSLIRKEQFEKKVNFRIASAFTRSKRNAFGDYPYKSANYSEALSINKAFSALSNSAVLNFIRLQIQMIFSSKACEQKLMKQ